MLRGCMCSPGETHSAFSKSKGSDFEGTRQ